ncbi:MAG: hypothetical protein M1836_000169 [Candelina mexicana]|nr:MAG: hypothetical protein M1836_000169 [Candelina mexicana]
MDEELYAFDAARLTVDAHINRRNSQKPTDELYASFKHKFPEIGPGTTAPVVAQSSASLSNTIADVAMQNPPLEHGHGIDKDHDSTPKGTQEPWKFTPSILDPESFAFTSFANQPPGYYTPTPGGTTLYHSQAGDLHTPSLGIGVGTPFSLSTSEGGMHAGITVDMHDFQQHHFDNIDPFAQSDSFAPGQFLHQDSGFVDHMEAPGDKSDTDMPEGSPIMDFTTIPFDEGMPAPLLQTAENFRYHVTLNAPTAMTKHADEIPVTYLNKGQAYSMSIVDTAPPTSSSADVKYRTFVRISFEDERQRQKPSACWQLWKEGRGTNEAHQRGGKLQAVEFVDPNAGGEEDSRRPKLQLDTASFDGFSVVWSAGPNGMNECSVAVRFNFLSTDFSHSKGVKGIPVRLCTKTEVIPSSCHPLPETKAASEVCFCKVKLFRDHGAERKLSNDVAHVKKTIDKLKQQIAQAESGLKDFGKRKRSGSTATKPSLGPRPGKVAKHKRTWSISSASSVCGRSPVEEDLHIKLATMQDMFTSTRPASVLFLRGSEQDDPDLHPVYLVGEPHDLIKAESQGSSSWERRQSASTTHTVATSCLVSPTPSSNSLHSQGRHSSVFRHPTSFNPPLPQNSLPENSQWKSFQQLTDADLNSSNPQHLASPPEVAVKIPKSSSSHNGMLNEWIEAIGIDASYQPPPEPAVKPVACIYILPKAVAGSSQNDYYRAVYLMQRTTKDLVTAIASKCGIDPQSINRTISMNSKGIKVIVDDDVVRQLPEGQDMKIEIVEINPDGRVKRELGSGSTINHVDHELGQLDHAGNRGFELKLLF